MYIYYFSAIYNTVCENYNTMKESSERKVI